MDKKYAIFDMDGTLVDSMGFWKSLGREYLASQGITENVNDVLRQTLMITLPEAAELFVNKFGLSVTPEEAHSEMMEIMAEHYRNDIPLKDGVTEYLEKLSQKGVRMCIASNTGAGLVDACLTRLGIKKHFEFLLSSNFQHSFAAKTLKEKHHPSRLYAYRINVCESCFCTT